MKKFIYLCFLSILSFANESPFHYNFSVEVGPIYWLSKVDGQEYAYSSSGNVENPSMPYQPGFKVLVGGMWNDTLISLVARYTWYQNHDHLQLTSDEENITPIFNIDSNLVPDAYKASEKKKLRFNTIDLDLGFNFNYLNTVGFRPFLGVKGAFITNNFTVNYYDFSHASKMIQQSHLSGAGLRAGLDMEYEIFRPISIFGNFSFSSLWNHYSNIRKDYGDEDLKWKLKKTTSSVDPMVEASLGLEAVTYFDNKKYRFKSMLLWENQVLFNFVQTSQAFSNSNFENLSLMGVTLLFRLDF